MKKNIVLKIFIFTLPATAYYLFILFVGIKTGELSSYQSVVKQQSDSNLSIYGLAYSDISRKYKLESALYYKPTILALGSSRVMGLRGMFFAEPKKFYNAGGGARRLDHFLDFVEKLEVKPELIIMGLDQHFFDLNYKPPIDLMSDFDVLESTDRMIQNFFNDYLNNKFEITKILKSDEKIKKIGIRAFVSNEGFLKDGSYYYGNREHSYNVDHDLNEKFQSSIQRVKFGLNIFHFGENFNYKILNELENFLKYTSKKNIKVIMFLPPFSNALWIEMNKTGKYGYLKDLNLKITNKIKDNKLVEFYDLSLLSTLSATDYEMLDGFHESQKLMAKIVLHMYKNGKLIDPYIKLKQLETLIARSKGHTLIDPQVMQLK